MEDFEREFGTKAMLTFKEKETTFLRMFHMISFTASGRPNLLMVGSTSSFHDKR